MSLIQTDLTGRKIDKVQRSIDRIKAFEPSGGVTSWGLAAGRIPL